MGVQNELNTALTYAREDANKECKRLTETAYEALEEIEKSWTSHVIQLSISLSETAREAEAKCEVTKIEQEQFFKEFTGGFEDTFEEWVIEEEAIVDEFIGLSKEAWDWIL